MDRGTKIYAFILALITIVIAIVFLYESPKVRQLNDRLSAIEEIKQFPYPFKIVRVEKHHCRHQHSKIHRGSGEQNSGYTFSTSEGRIYSIN